MQSNTLLECFLVQNLLFVLRSVIIQEYLVQAIEVTLKVRILVADGRGQTDDVSEPAEDAGNEQPPERVDDDSGYVRDRCLVFHEGICCDDSSKGFSCGIEQYSYLNKLF